MAHALITQLRTMVSFGVEVLQDRDCERAALILHKMQFSPPKIKAPELMTADQARRICDYAHEKKVPSLALAQAFQFDCELAQKDVIGEWVPLSELGKPTGVVDQTKGLKWMWGLRWEEIDDDLVLHHVTSRHGKPVVKDLNNAPMVRKELEATYGAPLTRAKLPVSGVVVVLEKTKQPWAAPKFRETWRKFAKACGVPDNIKNKNSKKGKGSTNRPGWQKALEKAQNE